MSARVTRVKICGITRPEDADAGRRRSAPTRIGFVFWPRARASIDAGDARARSPTRCRRS